MAETNIKCSKCGKIPEGIGQYKNDTTGEIICIDCALGTKKHNCGNCGHHRVTFSSAYCILNAYDYCLDSDHKHKLEHYWVDKI